MSYNYKTELCKSYSFNQQCSFGVICKYAHGTKELRQKPFKKYKSKKCKSFFSNGYCKYGSRCQFSHNYYTTNVFIFRNMLMNYKPILPTFLFIKFIHNIKSELELN